MSMPAIVAKRVRLPAADARQRILETAEQFLMGGGPDAVRVQAVARRLGITDAAVHHHFGSRDGLLDALLRFGGRRLRAAVENAVQGWQAAPGEPPDLARLITLLLDTFERRGYSRLALWLSLTTSRRRTGSGMFAALATAIEHARTAAAHRAGGPPPPRDEARYLATLLVMTLAAEPLMGEAFRRSVEFPDPAAATRGFRRWLARTLGDLIVGGRPPVKRRRTDRRPTQLTPA